MLLSQIRRPDGSIAVVAREGETAKQIIGAESVYALALDCARRGETLAERIGRDRDGAAVDLGRAYAEGRIAAPIHHPDPAHVWLTGTGLTHLGSATTREAMHQAKAQDAAAQSDSMRIFQEGLQGGKPAAGEVGVQPEWFYKGCGAAVVGPGAPLTSPAFAEDAGEEPEIAGIYVIDPDGVPVRVGFALANEFSDHVMERRNYLNLAHSKLRPACVGPEILLGALPEDIRGTSVIRREGEVIFEKPFLSGEANMSHSLANLEHHHFKYGMFRQPGDVHIHMFGTATLSYADGIRTQAGDVFEIAAPEFGLPLVNPVAVENEGWATGPVEVRSL